MLTRRSSAHSVEAAGLKSPIWQLLQASVTFPTAEFSSFFPAGQSWQSRSPSPLYRPTPQRAQACASSPVPASFRCFPAEHDKHSLLASPLYRPLLHGRQSSSEFADGMALYRPAPHPEHATASTPVAASFRYFPAAQLTHSEEVVPLYFPGEQLVQL